jgi:hypothetical protein
MLNPATASEATSGYAAVQHANKINLEYCCIAAFGLLGVQSGFASK